MPTIILLVSTVSDWGPALPSNCCPIFDFHFLHNSEKRREASTTLVSVRLRIRTLQTMVREPVRLDWSLLLQGKRLDGI